MVLVMWLRWLGMVSILVMTSTGFITLFKTELTLFMSHSACFLELSGLFDYLMGFNGSVSLVVTNKYTWKSRVPDIDLSEQFLNGSVSYEGTSRFMCQTLMCRVFPFPFCSVKLQR